MKIKYEHYQLRKENINLWYNWFTTGKAHSSYMEISIIESHKNVK